jgi:quercetin dioxygenase-like cupin family protein
VSANIEEIAESISEPWQPVVVAEANGFQMKVAKLHGEFPWHAHASEDELFYCTEGSFRIELEGEDPVVLRGGDVFVVAAGRGHRPVADEPAVAILFEPSATKQYGDQLGR